MFLAGVLVAGMHTNEIFIENGRFHGKIIAEAIAKQLRVKTAPSVAAQIQPVFDLVISRAGRSRELFRDRCSGLGRGASALRQQLLDQSAKVRFVLQRLGAMSAEVCSRICPCGR